MRRSRPLVVLLAIVSVVALAAMLPAQTQGAWVDKDRFTWSGYLGGPVTAVVGGEDLDGDGADDFVLGQASGGPGKVRVYSGAGRYEKLVLDGRVPWGRFGGALAWSDDHDGDGRRELLVGVMGSNMFVLVPGSVDLYSTSTGRRLGSYLHPTGTGVVLKKVGILGDLDGDGWSEVVGAFDPPELVIWSGRTGAVIRDMPVGGLGAAYLFDMITGEDLDGDGAQDILVGGAGLVGGQYGVIAYSGATGLQIWALGATLSSSRLGAHLAWTADHDGDGVRDLLASEDQTTWPGQPTPPAGQVHVLGGADGATLAAIQGTSPSFGWPLGGIGDVDTDGVPDFFADHQVHSGASLALLEILPPAYGGTSAVGPAGDVDADGRGDYLIADIYTYLRGWAEPALSYDRYTQPTPTLSVSGATPGGPVALAAATGVGVTSVTAPGCAGLSVPLAGLASRVIVQADAGGAVTVTRPVSPLWPETLRLVAVDVTTCLYSNVVAL